MESMLTGLGGRGGVRNAGCIKQYAPENIFNMDETALFYNAQPKRTLAIKGERYHGGKAYKDKVTVLLCCNADGSEKLRPLIVGKFEKLRCMKGVKHFSSCNFFSRLLKNKYLFTRLHQYFTETLYRQVQSKKIV
jgi:hypothetical protein